MHCPTNAGPMEQVWVNPWEQMPCQPKAWGLTTAAGCAGDSRGLVLNMKHSFPARGGRRPEQRGPCYPQTLSLSPGTIPAVLGFQAGRLPPPSVESRVPGSGRPGTADFGLRGARRSIRRAGSESVREPFFRLLRGRLPPAAPRSQPRMDLRLPHPWWSRLWKPASGSSRLRGDRTPTWGSGALSQTHLQGRKVQGRGWAPHGRAVPASLPDQPLLPRAAGQLQDPALRGLPHRLQHPVPPVPPLVVGRRPLVTVVTLLHPRWWA